MTVLLYIAKSFLEKKTKQNKKTTFLSEDISRFQDLKALNKNDDGRPDGWWEMLESRCVEGLRGGRAGERWWRNGLDARESVGQRSWWMAAGR